MLGILVAVEKELPRILLDESTWNGLLINYHPLTVEPLWTLAPLRHLTSPHQSLWTRGGLFHPHPWP